MTAEFPRTSYERAIREYDREFERALVTEIVNAIARASMVPDPDLRVMAIRTGETLEALITVLVSFAAMSPHFDVPSHLRQFSESLAKRVRREVAKARAEGFCSDFVHGAQRAGNA